MAIILRQVRKDDWIQIKFIYEMGIATGMATFETEAPPTYEQWIEKANLKCSLVAIEGADILGWCKLTPVSYRKVYEGVGEVSIYVHPNASKKGIGSLLLKSLINLSEEQGFWTLEAKIFSENKSSIHLHKKHGFREVGIRERIGKRDGIWQDNLLLERRSNKVGI